MKVQAILPAAGLGQRLKSKQAKPFILLNKKPLCVYALEAFEHCGAVHSVIAAVNEKHLKTLEDIVKKFKLKKVKRIVLGGAMRFESVQKALSALDSDTQAVVIHDAARPLIQPDLILRAIKALGKDPAVVAGVPIKPTIKKVDSKTLSVEETIARETLWEVQTPQVFKKEILLKAHELMLESNPTDDAVLVERMGIKVKMVMGDYKNIKITTQEDLAIAKMFLGICREGETDGLQTRRN